MREPPAISRLPQRALAVCLAGAQGKRSAHLLLRSSGPAPTIKVLLCHEDSSQMLSSDPAAAKAKVEKARAFVLQRQVGTMGFWEKKLA